VEFVISTSITSSSFSFSSVASAMDALQLMLPFKDQVLAWARFLIELFLLPDMSELDCSNCACNAGEFAVLCAGITAALRKRREIFNIDASLSNSTSNLLGKIRKVSLKGLERCCKPLSEYFTTDNYEMVDIMNLEGFCFG